MWLVAIVLDNAGLDSFNSLDLLWISVNPHQFMLGT